jgi:hypothetical protein
MASVVLCAFLAERKGRNRIVWALAGILFSVVAVLVIALLPVRRPTSQGVEEGFHE